MKKVIFTLLCLSAIVTVKAQDKKAAAPTPVVAPTPTPKPAPVAKPMPPQAQQVAAPKPPNPNAGVFKFKEETHDYGTVAEGPLAECDFEFKNTGKEPIVIKDAHGSCGCTVPKWPKEPIMPGKTGTIHVSYNTSGRPGTISKSVTINSDAQQQPMVLYIKGTVTPKPKVDAPAPAPTPAPAAH